MKYLFVEIQQGPNVMCQVRRKMDKSQEVGPQISASRHCQLAPADLQKIFWAQRSADKHHDIPPSVPYPKPRRASQPPDLTDSGANLGPIYQQHRETTAPDDPR
jgi:hypothetical protein